MKQEEITERNKQIALMLGLHHDKDAVIYKMSAYSWDMLRFHSDWNWLMEAVMFINSTHKHYISGRDLIYTMNYLLRGGYWGKEFIPKRNFENINDLFVAVSDFAKLKNEGKI